MEKEILKTYFLSLLIYSFLLNKSISLLMAYYVKGVVGRFCLIIKNIIP